MVRTLNFPMDDEDYSSLLDKKQAVKEALGLAKDLTWKEFMFLMKKTPVRTLVKAGKALNYDSKESRSK